MPPRPYSLIPQALELDSLAADEALKQVWNGHCRCRQAARASCPTRSGTFPPLATCWCPLYRKKFILKGIPPHSRLASTLFRPGLWLRPVSVRGTPASRAGRFRCECRSPSYLSFCVTVFYQSDSRSISPLTSSQTSSPTSSQLHMTLTMMHLPAPQP